MSYTERQGLACILVCLTLSVKGWSVLLCLLHLRYFASLLHPPGKKLGYYFQLGTYLGTLETHVLLSFLWSAFCKWPVINVTLLTLKIVVLKIQD